MLREARQGGQQGKERPLLGRISVPSCARGRRYVYEVVKNRSIFLFFRIFSHRGSKVPLLAPPIVHPFDLSHRPGRGQSDLDPSAKGPVCLFVLCEVVRSLYQRKEKKRKYSGISPTHRITGAGMTEWERHRASSPRYTDFNHVITIYPPPTPGSRSSDSNLLSASPKP